MSNQVESKGLEGFQLRIDGSGPDLRGQPVEKVSISLQTMAQPGKSICGELLQGANWRDIGINSFNAPQIGADLLGAIGQETEAWKRDLGTLANQRRGRRLRLGFDQEAAQAAALPFELLHEPESDLAMGRCDLTPISRYFPGLPTPSRMTVIPPLQLLVACPSANAEKGATPLPYDGYWEEVRNIVREQQAVDVYHAKDGTFDQLAHHLESNPDIQVLLFIGHGRHDLLEFEDAESYAYQVSGEVFAESLRCHPSLRLVILMSCEGGRPSPNGDPFQGVALSLLKAGIPAVVAMQDRIKIRAARLFCDWFFQRLACGDPVDLAATRARRALHREWPEEISWAMPAVYMQTPDGHLHIHGAIPFRAGICSFEGWDAKMEDRVDQKPLDLCGYFDGRRISDPKLWHSVIYPEIETYLSNPELEDKPLVLEMPAHCSVAYASGYVLEAKSGRDVALRQRSAGKTDYWRPIGKSTGPEWKKESQELQENGKDLAVGICLTKAVRDDAMAYIDKADVPAAALWTYFVERELPGQRTVEDGAHAYQLAATLIQDLERWKQGKVHLFIAAPNAFVFFLGQLSRGLRHVQLYEFDFGGKGVYLPSLEFRPSKSAKQGES